MEKDEKELETFIKTNDYDEPDAPGKNSCPPLHSLGHLSFCSYNSTLYVFVMFAIFNLLLTCLSMD